MSKPDPAPCRCDEPGFDPYACEADDCISFDSIVGGGPGRPVLGGWGTQKTVRCTWCPWSTTWQISDGSAESDLHRHTLAAHPTSCPPAAAPEGAQP